MGMRISASVAFFVVSIAACSDDSSALKSSTGTTNSGASESSGSNGSNGSAATNNGSTGNAGGSSGDGSPEQTCVDAINAYRKTIGAPAYARWNDEESCADGEAKSDSASGTAHGAFGTCNEFAQDECPGWPGPPGSMITDCLKLMWAEGPGGGHYDNMSSTQYTQAACGFYTLVDGSVWATQNFR